MRIAITGASGLIGTALTEHFALVGHEVTRVVRGTAPVGQTPGILRWDPAAGRIPTESLEGYEAIVHLAGASLAGRRWTGRYKSEIRESRVRGTKLLAEAIRGLARPPRVLISASAVGYYGDRPGEVVSERSPPGRGFLAEVCREWEAATAAAEEAGVRVVHARFGVVLSARGGALARMLPIFRKGLGGPVGSGRQMMSWIALDEVPHVFDHLLENEAAAGPVNVVAPGCVSNAEFSRTLAEVLGRRALLRVPAFLARLAFGEMADEVLLAGAAVQPGRLLGWGYRFRMPELRGALEQICGSVGAGEPR